MRRIGMALRLKSEAIEQYKAHHAAVWPEVLDMIRECNIRNYSIFLQDNYLFSYFEYHGTNMKADLAKMAAHKKTQEWWSVIEPLQDPLPTRKPGEWWAEMEEVFHLE